MTTVELKRVSYNNSLACQNTDGGYDVQKLVALHAHASRYDFAESFIKDLEAHYEMYGRDSVIKIITELMSNLISALDLNNAGIEHRLYLKEKSKWLEKLEQFMEDKPNEIEDVEGEDIRPEEWYKNFRPNSFSQFILQNPMPKDKV